MIDRLKYMYRYQRTLLVLAVTFDLVALAAIVYWVLS